MTTQKSNNKIANNKASYRGLINAVIKHITLLNIAKASRLMVRINLLEFDKNSKVQR